jgi:hypothetical protein
MVLMTVGGVGPGQSSRAFLRALLIPSRLRSVSFVSFRLHCRYAVADAAAATTAAGMFEEHVYLYLLCV